MLRTRSPRLPDAIHRVASSPILVALFATVLAGCNAASRPTAPPQRQDDQWLRRENLFDAFQPDASQVSLVNAYLLELACSIGDSSTFDLERTLRTWGFSTVRDFRDPTTSTYGYVASNDRMVLVTFGGTDFLNLRDLISDADALQLVYDEQFCLAPDARVHRGFRDGASTVVRGVMNVVERMSRGEEGGEGAGGPAKPVWVAGHSRGGALAMLAAAAFARAREQDPAFPPLAGVYTYGQPRVGNGVFAETLDARQVPIVRFVNGDDPIPRVPPESPARRQGYQHAGTLALLTLDGRLQRDPQLSDRIAINAGLGAHYQDAYQRAIYRVMTNPAGIEDAGWGLAAPSMEEMGRLPPPP